MLAEIEGDYEHATALHTDGLRLAEELGLWPVVAQQLGRLGRLAGLAADYPTALALHQRALWLAREQAFEPGASFEQAGLGLIARRQGQLKTAETQLAEVLDALAGHHDRAGWLLGAADAALRSVDRPLPSVERTDVDRISAVVRTSLGEAGFDKAWHSGRVS